VQTKKVGPVRLVSKAPGAPDGELPLIEVFAIQIRQAVAMARMDDPGLQERGEAKIYELAAKLAKQQEFIFQSKVNAALPRPTRKSPVTKRIIKLMRQARTNAMSYKDFLAAWLKEPQDGLRIIFKDPHYAVDDENEAGGRPAEYAPATLAGYWTPRSKKKNP
jgi:hypothetical protein